MGGSRSHSEFFWGGNHPKIALNSSDICVFCIYFVKVVNSEYILLKVVNYYFSVLSISVMGFPKKNWMGDGWVG